MAGDEKTEQPTGRRLSEARKKGNIPKSSDLNTAVVLFAGLMVIKLQFGAMGQHLAQYTSEVLGHFPRADFTPTTLFALVIELVKTFGVIVAPVLLLLMLAGLVSNYAQVGVLFTIEPLKPSLSKINPVTGIGRLFSRRSLVEVFKAIAKMGVVAWIIERVISDHYRSIVGSVMLDRAAIAHLFAETAWEIGWKASGTLLVFALADYAYQRWEHNRSLKMTKQEVKDEAKQSEGDPLVKQRIRRAQRDAARRRMMSDVPKATVVITNPTHFAIALRYDRDAMAAPVVVAKGVDLVAQRIKAVAAEAGVPMIENRPLARELHKTVEIGEAIPEELYTAIAEILVMVQKLNAKKRPVVRS